MSLRRLTVSHAPLKAAFKKLDKLLPKKTLSNTELVLRFSDGVLYIDGPGVTVDVPAEGTWPGRARLSVQFARVFARAPPAGDPLLLEYRDGSIFLRGAATVRFKAAWEDISAKRIDMPLDLSDVDLLKARACETPEALVSSGLARAAEHAEERFQRCVDLAYGILQRYAFGRAEFETAVRRLIVD